MKKILLSRKGEGYIDICVGIIALLSVLVISLNVYSFLTLKQDMDEISEQLIEVATYVIMTVFSVIFTYASIITDVKVQKTNTEIVFDSFVSNNSIIIYNNIKQGKNATDGVDTSKFRTSLKEFCTFVEKDGKYYSIDADGSEKFNMTVPEMGFIEDEKLELYVTFR